MSDSESLSGFQDQPSRYIVGIDLGTTNCAVAYVDTQQAVREIETFSIRQWVDFGTSQRLDLLPSFLYQPLHEEQRALAEAAGKSADSHVVGALARDRGLQLPGRQVASAKSWLCHEGVDRSAPILPWQGDDDVERLSPVEASARYLTHICDAWDQQFKSHPLAEQDIVLTLPASFDQVARQLTIEAAARAGLNRILPIEEPQAAFYAWLAKHKDDWESKVAAGQTILVCDIGGGTTDFTLIRVRGAAARQEESVVAQTATAFDDATRSQLSLPNLSLHRVAVGQHLILGGDNIDLALAKLAERKLNPNQALPPRQWDALRQACRVAKETLLGDKAVTTHTIHLPGSGSKLIGGGTRVEITADEVEQCVLDGFFARVALSDRPESQVVGFQEFGLPFATDPAITRHLASFLWEHRHAGRSDAEVAALTDTAAARPDWILFNGGVMTSSQLCDRLTQVVGSWFGASDGLSQDWQPSVLAGERLDRAVAIGAAYFGQVRRGDGVAIEAKLASSYYLQTSEDPPQAICIVPGSASAGESFSLSGQPMELAIGKPVQFPIYYSSTRLSDRVGETVELNAEHFRPLPPMRTVLEIARTRAQRTLPVVVEVELTQIGTLQIYCQSTESSQRWKLEFDVRASSQTDRELSEATGMLAGALDVEAEHAAADVLALVFGEHGKAKPGKLMYQLTEALELGRHQWPPSLLRGLWAKLMELEAGRRKSAAHEARWLNLLGYSLRPGYGLAADDWRVAQTWRTVYGKLAFATASSRNESLILWRRIAGGFTAGQQLTVYQQVAGALRNVLDPARRAKGGGGIAPQELTELLRLVGALELLPQSEKIQLGDWLLGLLRVKKWSACESSILWALGRLGARVPMYGPLNTVLDAQKVEHWINALCDRKTNDSTLSLALMQCSRKVDDRYRDVTPGVRERVIDRLQAINAPAHYISLLQAAGNLDSEETSQILGESLPLGLRLGPES